MNLDLDKLLLENKPASMIMADRKKLISDEELQQINKKAYMDATLKFLTTAYMREHVRVFAEDGTLPLIPDDPKLLDMLNNQADALAQKPPNILITINPRADVSLRDLVKVVDKLIKKKTITHYAYVYEVRKENEGLHCHMLVKYDDKPYNFKRGVKNTCKNICDSNNPNILNFKFIPEEHLLQKFKYILGEKKSSKMSGVNYTIEYRKRHNINNIYESNPLFPCRVAVKTIESRGEEEEAPPTTVGGVESSNDLDENILTIN